MKDRLSAAENYLALAENALGLARGARDSQDKDVILEIARTWVRLASASFDAAAPSPDAAEAFDQALRALSLSGRDGVEPGLAPVR